MNITAAATNLRAVVAAGLCGATLTAYAAHPLITEDSGTQGAGHSQFELNMDDTRAHQSGLTVEQQQFNAALTYGLSQTLDIAVGLPYARHSTTGEAPAKGLGDAVVYAKWHFFDDGQGWSLGLRPALSLPTGDKNKGLGNGRSTAALTLLSTYEIGGLTWLANAGLAYNGELPGRRKTLWALSAAALYNVAAQWSLTGDVGINRNPDADGKTLGYGLVGAIYRLDEATELDIGWRRSFGETPQADTVGVGLTLRW